MERENCPHCGARWFIEEFNYTLIQEFNGSIIEEGAVKLENAAKRIESSFTHRCLSCGYYIIQEIKHQ